MTKKKNIFFFLLPIHLFQLPVLPYNQKAHQHLLILKQYRNYLNLQNIHKSCRYLDGP
jgi:hypothetical protein